MSLALASSSVRNDLHVALRKTFLPKEIALNYTMTALGVVEHLRNLAADPQNRATIVKVRNLKCTVERAAMFVLSF